MQEQENKTHDVILHKKRNLYISSVVFLVAASILMYNQTKILTSVFKSQLSFSPTQLFLIFIDKNWLTNLVEKMIQGGKYAGIILVVEMVFFWAGIIFFMVYLWRMKKKAKWVKNDYIIFYSYAVMLASSLICAITAIGSTWYTYDMVQNKLQVLSTSELSALATKLVVLLENFTFSMTNILQDVPKIIQGMSEAVYSIKQWAQIPGLLNNWADTLSAARFYFILFFALSAAGVLVGTFLNHIHLITWFQQFKSEHAQKKAQEDSHSSVVESKTVTEQENVAAQSDEEQQKVEDSSKLLASPQDNDTTE